MLLKFFWKRIQNFKERYTFTYFYLLEVVLVQVAVPSRTDVEEYQNLRSAVNELVGRINGKFGKYLAP